MDGLRTQRLPTRRRARPVRLALAPHCASLTSTTALASASTSTRATPTSCGPAWMRCAARCSAPRRSYLDSSACSRRVQHDPPHTLTRRTRSSAHSGPASPPCAPAGHKPAANGSTWQTAGARRWCPTAAPESPSMSTTACAAPKAAPDRLGNLLAVCAACLGGFTPTWQSHRRAGGWSVAARRRRENP